MVVRDVSYPDLSLRGETAQDEADSLFWIHLEEHLDRTCPGNWTLQKDAERAILTLSGLTVEEARSWWAEFTQTLNAGNEGPGLDVAEPRFQPANHYDSQTREVVQATKGELWPKSAKAPVSFRRSSSPGYVALLDRHGPRPFFAEGWYWMHRGDRREGFRIGGLTALLFPEGRAALERLNGNEAGEWELVGTSFVQPLSLVGPDHPETLKSRINLANAYLAAGRHDDAIGLHHKTLAAMERILGVATCR